MDPRPAPGFGVPNRNGVWESRVPDAPLRRMVALGARYRPAHRRLRAPEELHRCATRRRRVDQPGRGHCEPTTSPRWPGVSFRPVPVAGPITLRFSEDVNGITTTSVLVRPADRRLRPRPARSRNLGMPRRRQRTHRLPDGHGACGAVPAHRSTRGETGVHRDTEPRVLPGRDRPGGQPIPPRGDSSSLPRHRGDSTEDTAV